MALLKLCLIILPRKSNIKLTIPKIIMRQRCTFCNKTEAKTTFPFSGKVLWACQHPFNCAIMLSTVVPYSRGGFIGEKGAGWGARWGINYVQKSVPNIFWCIWKFRLTIYVASIISFLLFFDKTYILIYQTAGTRTSGHAMQLAYTPLLKQNRPRPIPASPLKLYPVMFVKWENLEIA